MLQQSATRIIPNTCAKFRFVIQKKKEKTRHPNTKKLPYRKLCLAFLLSIKFSPSIQKGMERDSLEEIIIIARHFCGYKFASLNSLCAIHCDARPASTSKSKRKKSPQKRNGLKTDKKWTKTDDNGRGLKKEIVRWGCPFFVRFSPCLLSCPFLVR